MSWIDGWMDGFATKGFGIHVETHQVEVPSCHSSGPCYKTEAVKSFEAPRNSQPFSGSDVHPISRDLETDPPF